MPSPPPALRRIGGRVVATLPPAAQQRIRRALDITRPRRISLDTLDEELAEVARLFLISEDEARAYLSGFVVAIPDDCPPDPFSEAYRAWTWDLYRRISGLEAPYSPENETAPFDLEGATVRPYPFQTGSASVVSGDLAARSRLLRCIGEPAHHKIGPPARLVEFGPGWGNLTNDLVATGFHVTAVEVSDKFCTLIQRRCPHPDRLRVVQADMLAFEAEEPYDAAIFFESFHHCSDHLAMLDKLHQIVRPDGAVYFGSEPIEGFAYPWGPRLDGLSVWSSRTYGWLELGFDARYFDAALARTGWRASRQLENPKPSAADVLVATRHPAWRG